MGSLPKLIVFDLDYTLWPFWVDTHVDPPFTKKSNGEVYDKYGKHVEYYSDVPGILKDLKRQEFQLGIASSEIYPGCKINHFRKFHQNSGIPYTEMLFFDDEYRNIRDVTSLGVTCIHAKNGVCRSVVDEGFGSFAMKKSR